MTEEALTEITIGKQENSSSTYTEWLIRGTNKYVPAQPTVKTLPSGFYEVEEDDYNILLESKPIQTDELYTLSSPELLNIIDDIKLFWNQESLYKTYNFVHKRGILLYGDPGNGKSGIIQLILKYLFESKNGIAINIKDAESLQRYSQIISKFRSIEPTRPIIVILEDLDAMLVNDSWITSTLLNLLDGVKQINNVIYIATTNYPENLEARIIDRPSRFDRRYEIKFPTSDIRREYLKYKLSEDYIKTINLEEWISETDGMSLSHLKELIISVVLLGKNFDETLNILKNSKFKNSMGV